MVFVHVNEEREALAKADDMVIIHLEEEVSEG